MQNSIDKLYQQGDLLSATPQRLQYLLVDGAVRFAKKAKQHWETNDFEQGGDAMDRCEAILAEILKNVRIDRWSVADQIAGLYLFLLKSATLAHFRHDTEQLSKVISILETERETWRALCESPVDEPRFDKSHEQDQSAPTAGAPIAPPVDTLTIPGSFSLEA